jgi:hypothetical protein
MPKRPMGHVHETQIDKKFIFYRVDNPAKSTIINIINMKNSLILVLVALAA